MLHVLCVKSVQIQSYFWSVFSCIRTEYRDLRTQSENRKIRTRNNSVFGHFSQSGYLQKYLSPKMSHVQYPDKKNSECINPFYWSTSNKEAETNEVALALFPGNKNVSKAINKNTVHIFFKLINEGNNVIELGRVWLHFYCNLDLTKNFAISSFVAVNQTDFW